MRNVSFNTSTAKLMLPAPCGEIACTKIVFYPFHLQYPLSLQLEGVPLKGGRNI
jgi:hypothetical protein